MGNNKVTIEKFIIENCHLRENLLEKEFALQEKDASLQKSAKLLQEKDASLQKSAKLLQEKDSSLRKSAKLLQEKERIIVRKNAEIQRHLSSFRYQAGSCLYDATRSLKALLLLPLRLIKLFINYKKSK